MEQQKVSKIILFTLSACPTGRSMGTVLSEVKRTFDAIEFETVYVDVQTDITNHYRVKKNPTSLFLDYQGNELYRIEEFQETEYIIDLIERLNQQTVALKRPNEDNQASVEAYTVYLFQNELLVPLEVKYLNKTSVRAPRITAINMLLKTRNDGYENPFPVSATLELVNFKGNFGEIVINIGEGKERAWNKEKMKLALVKSLSHFGIDDLELTITAI
ncbi:thioredoxin family protein [Paenibacillus filicis]|uniref:Thioredoxin family protein n=1 Tax=Paenibacillus gyeongsangnamensis TaxID=3388067 RepID=A0ABT4Q9Z1_9BACL|nr:thioredoxin family protein [Paenibacillus filicis]MCZ8513699.1 thioredoxin family protein [Paenibacillus filicis]